MKNESEQIVFDSKTGWYLESLTFHSKHEAEILFHDNGSRRLYLELRGICTPQALLVVLDGFDDFHVIKRDTGTPFSEGARYLCRFYVDDDKHETIVDDYEAYESTEQGAAPYSRPGVAQG